MPQKRKNILLVEPFFAGSHAQWAKGLAAHSAHSLHLLTMPGRHWKWRMHGAALTLAQQALTLGFTPDLIVASEMLDLAQFLAFTRKKWGNVPTVAYFHENQLTYPWSSTDPDLGQRDNHYAYLNYSTALAADGVHFNSTYHQSSFLGALPAFLQQFPDHTHPETVELIAQKSSVLPIGISLQEVELPRQHHPPSRPVIVWNHRWEYDKNPDAFFRAIFALQAQGHSFDLIVLGESYAKSPTIFEEAKIRLGGDPSIRLLHWGFAPSPTEYREWLKKGSLLPVTSQHDFFGVSVVEAIAAGCAPLLPNRLAYPEHIPPHLHPVYLYDQEPEYHSKLAQWLTEKPDSHECAAYVTEKYDWANVIPQYDQAWDYWMG